jgi:hypothetical protein
MTSADSRSFNNEQINSKEGEVNESENKERVRQSGESENNEEESNESGTIVAETQIGEQEFDLEVEKEVKDSIQVCEHIGIQLKGFEDRVREIVKGDGVTNKSQ